MSESESPKFFASLGGKINVGNYESRDINFGISGIPIDCSAEYLQEIIAAGISRQQIVLNAMAAELDRILREDFGR